MADEADQVRQDDEVLTERRGDIGHLILNRPRAINALNQAMVQRLTDTLTRWADDDDVRAVVLSGAGDRGLCAGGDIVAIYHSLRDGHDAAARFWAEEYALDAAIAAYPKPYIALMDGLVLGGGIGLSAHGRIRVVTERTRVGMPEVSIGFFPDVAGSWLLARAPGELGTHLALTGGTASGSDAIALGLADHYVPSERIPAMLEALEIARLDPAEPGGVVDIVAGFAIEPSPSELLTQRDWIDAAYAGDDAQTIVDRLAASPEPRAREAAATILSKSPTSVAVTLAALRRAPSLADVRAALDQDLRIATHFTRGSEVLEGIRAQVIDKDRTPHWNPATLAEVSPETVAEYFEEHV